MGNQKERILGEDGAGLKLEPLSLATGADVQDQTQTMGAERGQCRWDKHMEPPDTASDLRTRETKIET